MVLDELNTFFPYLMDRKKGPSINTTVYIFQDIPPLEYCSHIWGNTHLTTLILLDSIKRRTIKLINNPVLSTNLPSFSNVRADGDIFLSLVDSQVLLYLEPDDSRIFLTK